MQPDAECARRLGGSRCLDASSMETPLRWGCLSSDGTSLGVGRARTATTRSGNEAVGLVVPLSAEDGGEPAGRWGVPGNTQGPLLVQTGPPQAGASPGADWTTTGRVGCWRNHACEFRGAGATPRQCLLPPWARVRPSWARVRN